MNEIFETDGKHQEMASDATLRDFFAAKAMHAALTGGLNDGHTKSTEYIPAIAEISYIIADAMLAERKK